MSADEIGRVMDAMPYGLYIIGSRADGEVNGMMADWVMQASFRPRLIAVAFENDARTLQNIRASRALSVNALPQDHGAMELAAKFAQPYFDGKVKGRTRVTAESHHKLVGVPHSVAANGCPILDAAMAWLTCEAEQFLQCGDHTLVIASVLDGRVTRDAEPLTSSYTGWNYSG
jgi:flavin reductase (DIM6/NTAB) family NADH-FMN oxidoreductase RutF